MSDEQARTILLRRLSEQDRIALGTGACASMTVGEPGDDVGTLAVATRVGLGQVREGGPGQYRCDVPGHIEYEFESIAGARFLTFPGLKSDQELEIHFLDTLNRRRPARFVRWQPSPHSGGPAVVELERMIHLWGEPINRIVIQFTRPGEITLERSPRLLR